MRVNQPSPQDAEECEEIGSTAATHLLCVADDHVRVAVDPFLRDLGVLLGVREDGEDICAGY